MKFNKKDYTANDTYIVYSENYYKCPLKKDNKSFEGIVEARRDWHLSKNVPRKKQNKIFWLRALHRNQIFKDLCLSLNNIRGSLSSWPYSYEEAKEKGLPPFEGIQLEGIYSKKDDEFLGFCINRISYQNIYNIITCLLPEHRQKSIMREVDIAGGKFIFLENDYLSSSYNIVCTGGEFKGSHTIIEQQKLMDPNFDISTSEIFKTYERGYEEIYSKITTDRGSWITWINLPENKKYKEAAFEYKDLYRVI